MLTQVLTDVNCMEQSRILLSDGSSWWCAGALRASVSAAGSINGSLSESGLLLYGQTEATANPEGIIHITDMLLRARPDSYNLSVSLLDYPVSQVFVLSIATCSASCFGHRHGLTFF